MVKRVKKNFLTYNFITMQIVVVVSHTLCVHVGSLKIL